MTQLDLFVDSRAVMLANEVADRLLARDARGAAAAFAALEGEDSAHPAAAPLGLLVQFACDWEPVEQPPDVARAAARLEQQVAPAAWLALRERAATFVRPYYLELAAIAARLPYDPAHARAHVAFLLQQGGDFAASERATLGMPDWERSSDALRWLTLARHRLRGLAAARATLFALCWLAPARAAGLVGELADEALQRDWDAFVASDWRTTPDAEVPVWFPAWYLIEHPAAVADLELANCYPGAAADAARLVARILDREREGNSKALIDLRRRLRDLHGDLFALYMQRRTVFHR